jgi:NAD(P)-dependent dehydrogenase (short-subunit alcohol dehydrogenase family)
VRPLDLSGLESVRRVAQTWSGSLEVLINNAGVMATPLRRTQQGLELQIGTNHLGHFALNNLLLPIRDRVVTISSNAHKAGSIACQCVNPRPNGFSTRVIEQGGGPPPLPRHERRSQWGIAILYASGAATAAAPP